MGKPHSPLGMCMHRGVTGILFKCRDEQVAEYLLPCIRGERKDAFALTEPGAGSDARAITTRAVRDGDDWVINGVKQFISAADIADFIILASTRPIAARESASRRFFWTRTRRASASSR